MAEAWKKYPDLPPHSQGPSDGLEGHIAALKEAVAKAKAIGEQRRQVIEVARERIYGMAVEIVAFRCNWPRSRQPTTSCCSRPY
jgi:hypothetical protein